LTTRPYRGSFHYLLADIGHGIAEGFGELVENASFFIVLYS
jgi:hypothetical protein